MIRLHTDSLRLMAGTSGKILCHDLSVQFRTGENWVILGANGSGKTTLLHTLAGLRRPAGGQVYLDGQLITDYSFRQRATQIGILFQQGDATFPTTVLETVLSGRHPYRSDGLWNSLWQWEDAEDHKQAKGALQAMALSDMGERLLTTLSGGEQRRVEIATLLTQNPPIALLDEPTNHLDLHHQIHVLSLLTARTQQQRVLNVFVLHDVNLASRFCSHGILLFADGSTRHGPLAEVLTLPNLETLYACSMRQIDNNGRPFFIPG